MEKNKILIEREKHDVVITQLFDAPCDLVWKAYTDPGLIPQWWGPRNLSTTVETMDVKKRGKWRFVQKDSDGKEYAFNGVYKEIIPKKELIYTFEYEAMPGHEILETITFDEIKGKTKLTDKSLFKTDEDLDGMVKSGMEEGATESMERFAELLDKIQKEQSISESSKISEVIITRFFNASQKRLFKAWTDPKILMSWWGPKGFSCPVCKIDLHVGGKYFSCMRSPEGKDFYSTGVYKEIKTPSKLVMTDSFADEKGNVVSAAYYGMSSNFPQELLVSLTFEKLKHGTIFTLKHSGITEMSKEDHSNMEQGWKETLDKLSEILK